MSVNQTIVSCLAAMAQNSAQELSIYQKYNYRNIKRVSHDAAHEQHLYDVSLCDASFVIQQTAAKTTDLTKCICLISSQNISL